MAERPITSHLELLVGRIGSNVVVSYIEKPTSRIAFGKLINRAWNSLANIRYCIILSKEAAMAAG